MNTTGKLVDQPTLESLEALHRSDHEPDASGFRVSIFMPTHEAGAEVRQGPIRLKNLLRQAKDELVTGGMEEDDAEELLREGYAKVDDYDFWRFQLQGLALFLATDGTLRQFRVPFDFDERVVVGDHFVLTPLIPLIPGDNAFHVLALSQNKVRLFKGRRFSLDEVDDSELPEELREVVGFDYEQKSLQFYSSGKAGGGGRQQVVYHGHGDDKEEEREMEKFIRQVDGALNGLIPGTPRPPLVVAAVGHVGALFRNVSKHGNVVEDIAEGNADDASAQEIRTRVWPIIEPVLQAPIDADIERFRSLQHTEQASDDLSEIVAAAKNGRVDTLFVAQGEHRWGTFDEETQKVELNESTRDGDDLLSYAAMESLANSGAVHVLEAESVPSENPAAAIFRY